MYTCDERIGGELICDPVCDFCCFCEQDCGEPIKCLKGKDEYTFNEGLGYCDEFKCWEHEKEK